MTLPNTGKTAVLQEEPHNSSLSPELYGKQVPTYIPARARRWFLTVLAAMTAAMAFTLVLHPVPLLTLLGSLAILAASVIPLFLWFSGKSHGFPIFPLYAATFLWTYAGPLVLGNPVVEMYSPQEHLLAGAKVAIFLITATFFWLLFTNSKPRPPRRFRAFPMHKSSMDFFLYISVLANIFYMGIHGGWFEGIPILQQILRRVVYGLTLLSFFTLSYNLGTGVLRAGKARAFKFLLFIYLITTTAGLLLIEPLSGALLVAIGYTAGRKKTPWLFMTVVIVFSAVLHYGKGDMRQKYWYGDAGQHKHFIQPWEYPQWYGEWINYSINYLRISGKRQKEEKERASLFQRASLVHIFLEVQARAPKEIPYLRGKTYTIIPELLVPRVFHPGKPSSHEGTTLLNRQTREDSYRTTIAWGQLNEAYANFGFGGCLALAMVMGSFWGVLTRWSNYTPLVSFRSLFAVILISACFQSEWSASVYVTAIWQAFIVLAVVSVAFMRTFRNRSLAP